MPEPRIGAALLAAGSSRRFGEVDKLAQDFRGKPLGEHAAGAIPLALFKRTWVVTGRGEPAWLSEGFERVINCEAEDGMGTSVALVAQLAIDAGLDALLIALADMPMVPIQHFQALIAAYSDSESLVVSEKGSTRLPPAVFGSAYFAELAGLTGDKGARGLLARGKAISCPSDWLVDIDTPQALQAYGHSPAATPKPGSIGEN